VQCCFWLTALYIPGAGNGKENGKGFNDPEENSRSSVGIESKKSGTKAHLITEDSTIVRGPFKR